MVKVVVPAQIDQYCGGSIYKGAAGMSDESKCAYPIGDSLLYIERHSTGEANLRPTHAGWDGAKGHVESEWLHLLIFYPQL